ncbi:alpha/beta hydrolase [Candidatus Saccharibacteria bacterium]|nr:alpha/beta hydrolase [Candidatus Saccharibacteria bacterium]
MLGFFERVIGVINSERLLAVTYDSGGKRKPTIVLIHGIASTSRTWGPVIKRIDKEKYRVVAMDLLGFGSSPRPAVSLFTVNDHIRYIRRTLKSLGIKKFKLVGHSMGAIIAAKYSRLYPKEVIECYLLSLPLYNIDLPMNLIIKKKTDFFMSAYDFMMKNKDFTINNSQFLRKLLKIDDGIDVNQGNWESFRLSLQNTIIGQDTFADLRAIHAPINILYGSLDEFLIPEIINQAASIEGVSITKVNGADHAIGEKYAIEIASLLNGDK